MSKRKSGPRFRRGLIGDGKAIQKFRLDRGMKQEQLAKICDVRRTTVATWENRAALTPKTKRNIEFRIKAKVFPDSHLT